MKVEFHRHNLGERELRRIAEVLQGPILTTGAAVAEFEKKFAEYLGCEHVIGLTSCTAALHLALLACDIGPGHEVITTPMTFVATANAILHAGATPVFVDVEPKTGNLDAPLVEAAITPKTRAIMPVHLYGQMCDMRALRDIADRHGLRIIEDCAHCIEAVRDGVKPGQLGDLACYSFYATKNITCGEGGAVSVHDGALADRLRTLRLHGMSKSAAERHTKGFEHWDVEEVGWKYNMDNIQGALLIDQIGDIDQWWKRREAISLRYQDAFSRVAGVDFPRTAGEGRSARHLFTIWVDPALRDVMLEQIQVAGVGVAVNYRAVHLLSVYVNMYGYKRGTFPIAESIGDRTISLPLYPAMSDSEVEYVIETVIECHRNAMAVAGAASAT